MESGVDESVEEMDIDSADHSVADSTDSSINAVEVRDWFKHWKSELKEVFEQRL
jgi:hypothetical protein